MKKTTDNINTKRQAAIGEKTPTTGFQRKRALYTATGGETSIDLSLLSTPISYMPGKAQLSVKRSSGGNVITGIDFFETSTTSIGFPAEDALIAGEIVEIIQEFQVVGVMAVNPRPDMHTETATAGQTVITANFSWPYNMNAGKGRGAVDVQVHGVSQTRGVDYTENDLSLANTNQITLTTPLVGGENLAIIPLYQVIDDKDASTQFNNYRITNLIAFNPHEITSITGNNSLSFDNFYTCDDAGATTQTLPYATGSNRIIVIENTGTGNLSVAARGSDLINGAASQILGQYMSIKIRDYASGKWIIMY